MRRYIILDMHRHRQAEQPEMNRHLFIFEYRVRQAKTFLPRQPGLALASHPLLSRLC